MFLVWLHFSLFAFVSQFNKGIIWVYYLLKHISYTIKSNLIWTDIFHYFITACCFSFLTPVVYKIVTLFFQKKPKTTLNLQTHLCYCIWSPFWLLNQFRISCLFVCSHLMFILVLSRAWSTASVAEPNPVALCASTNSFSCERNHRKRLQTKA